MDKIILFSIFVGALVLLLSGALGMYINGEKGKSLWLGALIGALLPLLGHIALALQKTETKVVVQEMYDRNLIKLADFEKTMEVVIKENKA